MLKKLKELFGFPTEQEQAAAKQSAEPVKEVKAEPSTQPWVTFPTSDAPATEAPAKVKKPRVAKPKAEKPPVEKTPAAKKPAAKKPATRKAKAPVVGSGDVKQS